MECIFCKIAAKKAKAWIVYSDKEVIAFFDRASATKGHTLIIPIKHYANLYEVPDNLLSKIIVVSKKLAKQYRLKLKASSVNLVNASGKSAGQDVFHFHIHLVPRYHNDGINEHSWWKSNYQTKYNFDNVLKQIKK